MRHVLAGVDEAGYGPTLGPFCVGLSVFELSTGSAATPDLWSLLSDAVCREPGRAGAADRRGRVAVADSKVLKLSNAVRRVHPLIHLERGVLSFLRCLDPDSPLPGDDLSLFDRLGVCSSAPACYHGPPSAIPVSMTAGQLAISSALVEAGMTRAQVRVDALAADVTWEPNFNRRVRDTGNKADVSLDAVGRHFRSVWNRWAGATDDEGQPVRLGIVCDRLGGRQEYAEVLERMIPGSRAEIVEESPTRSRYILTGLDTPDRRAGVAFLTEGESAHLPVALASMVAKFVRELAMARFNAFWAQRARAAAAELRPTAGYALDARRWLDDANALLSAEDRRDLVRIA